MTKHENTRTREHENNYTDNCSSRQALLEEISKLKQELTELKTSEESLKGRYGLHFERKPEHCEEVLNTKIPLFKEDPSLSLSPKTTGDSTNSASLITSKPHLLIEGENLHILMALQQTHREAIDLIYIDPPYNTGNKDFTYNDKFVDKEDGYRHSKWLSFMEKRLKLAKELLKDTGVIFISIDGNEHATLKLLCDQIFGYQNNLLHWKTRGTGGQVKAGALIRQIEYVLIYFKNSSKGLLHATNKCDGSANWISFRKTGGDWKRASRPNQFYPIYVDPTTLNIQLAEDPSFYRIVPVDSQGEEGFWHNGPETAYEKIKEGRLRARKSNNRIVIEVNNAKEGAALNEGNLVDIPSTGGALLMKDMNIQFTNPKPIDLISHVIKMAGAFNVLDFFGGSGTTLHATMALNAEDGGTRQCILATNNEGTFEDPANPGKNLPGGIFDNVTYPRIKKVSLGYTNNKGTQVDGLGQPVKVYRVSEAAGSFAHKDLPVAALIKKSLETLLIKENIFYAKPLNTQEQPFLKSLSNITGYQDTLNTKNYMLVAFDDLADLELETAITHLLTNNPDSKIAVYKVKESDDDTYLEHTFKSNANVVFKDMPDIIKNAFKLANSAKQ